MQRCNQWSSWPGRRFRPDLVFDDVKLLVEIDGFAFHGDRDAFERDRSRQNLLMLRSARGDQPGHPRADQAR